jgi:hypothetical protein
MHIYNWYHSITASILPYTRNEIDCMYTIIPLAPLFNPSQLTWNPPCCDRIRPPRSQVARELTPHFPHPTHVAPYPKSRPPRVFQTQIYIHQDDIANPTHKSTTVYCLPTKEKKLIFSVSVCSKQTDVCVYVLRLQQTNGSCNFHLVPLSGYIYKENGTLLYVYIYICILICIYIYIRKTELAENDNFCLFIANGKQKRQTSVYIFTYIHIYIYAAF